MKPVFHWIFFGFALFGCILLFAQPEKNKVAFKHQYYTDNNENTVVQPLLHVNLGLFRNTILKAHFLLDAITAASRRPYNPLKTASTSDSVSSDAVTGATTRTIHQKTGIDTNFNLPISDHVLSVDAVTGASIGENRTEFGGGIAQTFKSSEVEISASGSRENDYQSFSVGMAWTGQWFNRNLTTKIEYKRFLDKMEPLPQSIRYGEIRKRNFDEMGFELSQILSPKSLLLMSYNIHLQNYFPGLTQRGDEKMLGRLYYPVLVEDTASPSANNGGIFFWETYPSERFGNSGTIKWKQIYRGFPKSGSVQLALSRFWGDWGISSYSFDISASQYLAPNFVIQPRYRFYSQSQAIFYRDRYDLRNLNPNSPEFMSYITVDPRLSEFDSHLFDLKFILYLNRMSRDMSGVLFGLAPSRIDFQVQRYLRGTSSSDLVRFRRFEFYGEEGLQAWIFRTGISFQF